MSSWAAGRVFNYGKALSNWVVPKKIPVLQAVIELLDSQVGQMHLAILGSHLVLELLLSQSPRSPLHLVSVA